MMSRIRITGRDFGRSTPGCLNAGYGIVETISSAIAIVMNGARPYSIGT